MKKLYIAPKADKIDFNYTENVTASGAGHECPGNGGNNQPKPWYPWFPWWKH